MPNEGVPTAAPVVTRDFAFFYDGLRRSEFLVQRCGACGTRRHPAGPMCPNCRSLAWTAEALRTEGTVHSYVVHHYPVMPDYPSPHVVALVDVEDGIRVTGELAGVDPASVAIDMPVVMEFVQKNGDFWLHRFSPAGAR